MKKITVLVLTIALMILSVPAISAAADEITLNVNGVNISAASEKEAPYVGKDGRTLISLRHVKSALPEITGLKWDQKKKRVELQASKYTVEAFVGQSYLIVNGKKKAMDTKPVIRDGVTYLPARFIAEALGYRAEYLDLNKTVYILSEQRSNFARYNLTRVEKLPVTVAVPGLEITYHEAYIYPFRSGESKQLIKDYDLYIAEDRPTFKEPTYLMKVKMTLKNTGSESVGSDFHDIEDKHVIVLGTGGGTRSLVTLDYERPLEQYFAPWRLEKGESLTTTVVVSSFAEHLNTIRVGVENKGKMNVATLAENHIIEVK